MSYTLHNEYLQFRLKPEKNSWDLSSRSIEFPILENLRMGVGYRLGKTKQWALDQWFAYELVSIKSVPSPHGPTQQIILSIGPDRNHLQCTVTFAISEGQPFLFWKLALKNQGRNPLNIDRLELFNAGFINVAKPRTPTSLRLAVSQEAQRGTGAIHLSAKPSRNRAPFATNLAFFSHGWQSWSFTGVYSPFDRYQHTRLGAFIKPTIINAGITQSRQEGLFFSDMFGVLGNRANRMAVLAGFLSQKQQFGIVEAYLHPARPALRLWANGDGARLDPGEEMVTDWACLSILHIDSPDPLGPYLEAVAREHGLPMQELIEKPSPTGWCSWYQFSKEDYTANVSADDIHQNVQAIARLKPDLPLELVQIDDGFEAQVGDWFSFGSSFPNGVAPLAEEVRALGLKPGLWLAPFSVHPKSRLFFEHPDWLLRGRFNRPVNAGYNWNTFTSALDLTHPDALTYICNIVHTAVQKWGFSYLKLDFLYAAALPGRHHNPRLTRAQILRAGLETIRQAAGGEAFLLGCGCPLGSAIGLMDGMRVSADTAQRWNPSYQGIERFFRNEDSLPSARNAVHNSLTRTPFHRRWWINDPYCLQLRPDTLLTQAELHTLATVISLTGGSLLLSDHLPNLPPEGLKIATVLLPLIGKRPYILDWFDNPTPTRLGLEMESAAGRWHLLGLFNWSDTAQAVELHLEDFYLDAKKIYYAREFWSGKTNLISKGVQVYPEVPAHGCILLALRTTLPSRPCYIGSDLHISQGLEVNSWQAGPDSLSLRLQRPGHTDGEIELYLPGQAIEASCEGYPLAWQVSEGNCYRFAIAFDQKADILIRWNK
jgi:alpha-galactosidase